MKHEKIFKENFLCLRKFSKRKFQRRAQTEILGLAIVVLLISVGFLFAVGFFVQKPSTFKKEFTQTEIGSNLLNALLKITTDCNNLDMTELIQDCAENPINDEQIDCEPSTLATIEGSCLHIQVLTDQIFLKTLDEWNFKNYQLRMQKVTQTGREPLIPPNDIVVSQGTCSGEKKASPPYIIPTDEGDVWIVLYLCG